MDLIEMKKLSLKTKKLNGIQKIDLNEKKSIDYADMAYKEAVLKLKCLLSESYTLKPMIRKSLNFEDLHQITNIKITEPKQGTVKNGVINDNYTTKDFYKNINLQEIFPELNLFIEQQDKYIQQLELESQFCKKQLSTLLYKVREIIAENQTLQYRNKIELCRNTLDNHTTINEIDKDSAKFILKEISENKKQKKMEGSNIVLESRINELEAQLAQTKLELCQAQDNRQINLSESCLNNDISQIKAQLTKALDTKHESEMKIKDLQKSLVLTQDKEAEATQKIKQLIGSMQHIEFEKCQRETEIKGSKEEVNKQHKILKDATQEAHKLIAKERQQIKQEHNQVEQCQKQNKLLVGINSYKEQLEKAIAELVDYKEENLKLSKQIASLKKEVNINKYTSQYNCPIQSLPKLESKKQVTSVLMDPKIKHVRDMTRIGKTTSASIKKHTVKVDLKVKVVPKQK